MVGELGSGMGWRIPAIGNSNMSTNGSSSYNNNEEEILKTRSIVKQQQFYSSVIMYCSVMIYLTKLILCPEFMDKNILSLAKSYLLFQGY